MSSMIDRKKIEELLAQVQKPGRYLGNEWNAVKKDLAKIPVKFALVFPDLYEVGMSYLGFKLLYHLLNERDDVACERVFSPDVDLDALLRKERLPIFTLESKEPLLNFDIVGFSLTYELNYTNVLNILDLADIPLMAKERDERHPLIIAGGPASCNPEPMSDFMDLFVIGEAEEAVPELIGIFRDLKRNPDCRREDLLKNLSSIEGIYVPSFYRVVRKRTIANLDGAFYPTRQIVPYVEIIHDRASVEIMRGCPNLCRFCQARTLYHHKRQRSAAEVVRLAEETINQTGYDEISLLSLSSGDHSEIIRIITDLINRFDKKKISVSLPSLRVDKTLKEFPALLSRIRKSGLTFAPEAGSSRLRALIKKEVDTDELASAIEAAYNAGWKRVKLYFMIGLPGETCEDIDAIVEAIYTILKRNKRIHINVSIASFIPKPHTPFQWEAMEREEGLRQKTLSLKQGIRTRRVKLKFHDTKLSILEAIFSRGDSRLGSVILQAFKKGCRFDGWIAHLDYGLWMEAFKEASVDPYSYIYRRREFQENLPWEHIECGMPKAFLMKEAQKARQICLTNSIS